MLKANKSCQNNPLFNLTDMEMYAIIKYKSSSSYMINEELRNKGYNKLDEKIKKIIDNISSGLEKLPIFTGTVYRNIDLDAVKKYNYDGDEKLSKFIDEHRKGNIVTYPAFTSTSKSKNGYPIDSGCQANFEIISKSGRDITSLQGIAAEEEVLYDRNKSFKILDSFWNKDKSRFIIKMEEL